jgi:hypothetical protein
MFCAEIVVIELYEAVLSCRFEALERSARASQIIEGDML